MLVEINSLDNGSGVNSNLDVYLSYNDKQKLFELRPYCRIDENDFSELLSEGQFNKFMGGEFHFNLSKKALADKANKIY
jgi:hypothetical protein